LEIIDLFGKMDPDCDYDYKKEKKGAVFITKRLSR